MEGGGERRERWEREGVCVWWERVCEGERVRGRVRWEEGVRGVCVLLFSDLNVSRRTDTI